MVCSLVRIEYALFDSFRRQRVDAVDREIVSYLSETSEDLGDQFLTICRELEGHAEIVIVKWRRVAEHVDRIIAFTDDILDGQPRNIPNSIHDSRRYTVDHVHLARLQSRDPRRVVVYDDDLDLVGKGRLICSPVICETLTAMADTGLVGCYLVRTRRNSCRRIIHATIRLHHKMVIGQHIWELGIRFRQSTNDISAIGANVADVPENTKRARL